MTIRFVAKCVGVDDVVGYDCLSALVIEKPAGVGHVLHFEASFAQPGHYEIANGQDTYCLVVNEDRSVCGGITEISLHSRLLRVVLTPPPRPSSGSTTK